MPNHIGQQSSPDPLLMSLRCRTVCSIVFHPVVLVNIGYIKVIDFFCFLTPLLLEIENSSDTNYCHKTWGNIPKFSFKVNTGYLRNCTSKLEIISSLSNVLVSTKPPDLTCISLVEVISLSERLTRVSRKAVRSHRVLMTGEAQK